MEREPARGASPGLVVVRVQDVVGDRVPLGHLLARRPAPVAQQALHDALGALAGTLVPHPGDDDDRGPIRHRGEPYDGGGRWYHRATMTGSGGRAQELDCVVVGGGLAGLSCAHDLMRAGRSVHVVEAEEAPGGRARSVWHRGRPVDRGFQVLFRAYPRTRALLRSIGISRRDLRPVAGGAVFVDGGGARRLGTSRLAVASFTGLAPGDRARLMRLGTEVAARPPQSLLDDGEDAGSTEDFLRERGFSEDAIERFFRPLFGVILLDRGLSADAGYFRFLFAMLARGPAVIPSDGLGMVAEWTTAAVRQGGGMVELGVRAAALEADATGRRVEAVLMEDGRRLAARQVVLAVEAPVARELLTPSIRRPPDACPPRPRRRSARPSSCGLPSTGGGASS